MSLKPWKDHLGNNVIDHLGADIQFRSTSAQINISFGISPTMSVRKPMGSVKINVAFNFAPSMSTRVFMATRIINRWEINPSAGQFITRWNTIILKNIGASIYNG